MASLCLCRFSGVGSTGLRLVATAATTPGTRGLLWGMPGSLNALVLPRMTVSSFSSSSLSCSLGTLETRALCERNRPRLFVITPDRFALSSQFGGSRPRWFSSAAEGGQGEEDEDVFKAVLSTCMFFLVSLEVYILIRVLFRVPSVRYPIALLRAGGSFSH
jgi:hypothetical protein